MDHSHSVFVAAAAGTHRKQTLPHFGFVLFLTLAL
jgi:hypothetical protein